MRSFSRVRRHVTLGSLDLPAPLRRTSVVAAGLAIAMAVGPAWGGDTSTAEHLFRQGLEAMKQSRFKEACDAFAGSNEADPSPGTQINLALCNEKQSKLASAWGWYRTAAGLADQRGQKERADLARAEALKLEPKLHRLVITVKVPTEGLAVTRNGVSAPAATLGSDVPVDPGECVVEATAKGKKPWRQTVVIAATPGIDRLDIPPLDDAPVEALPPGGYEKPAAGRDGTAQRNIGLVVGGVGIAAGVVAIAVQFLALSENDKSAKNRDAAASEPDAARKQDFQNSYDSHRKAAKTNQAVAIGTGAGAIVLIGVGITLILTAPSGSRSADLKRPLVVPILGSGTAGVGLVGTF